MLSTTILWVTGLLLLVNLLPATTAAPHETVLLLITTPQHIQTNLAVLPPTARNQLALQDDEGVEETEEGTEAVEDYHDDGGNDGRYIPDTINYDVDESENVTKYEDYQEIQSSMDRDYDDTEEHSSAKEGRANEGEELTSTPQDKEEVQLAPVVIQVEPKPTSTITT
ncbi:uncharacterized protein [Anabrus simplex]|uniref:uncharacterized protein n=1 Tax=Anabrus simplex TaxID=316456 RepID=UPI0035A28805